MRPDRNAMQRDPLTVGADNQTALADRVCGTVPDLDNVPWLRRGERISQVAVGSASGCALRNRQYGYSGPEYTLLPRMEFCRQPMNSNFSQLQSPEIRRNLEP